ncbi:MULTISPECIES: DUF4124 domain-containing protein [Psychrobacter]|uniref:DUF4124 domain-containing protein n=1 Tax=Psychrobacter TaxID=497 RepID=UPI00086F5226|nr:MULTISPECIES: DUF4124 domain-containing protein [Psychrobacter]MBA6243128.1 DUF4124 domain-containing protein [Psychrobacter sp. Urea-trap-18]MBA6286186.1 DUF4124 domain-containing protein [Psychrobacter sp. Urea-trap-16]MBA6317335.1 DUF4124 domain-containing protein [Psychrobacter sp. Urea-trap-20]MBA6334637.1 DUF4124 domain-containing protein [Psychrobacter sp. Urea-trap-19]OEH68109.1 MAG: hypothetical protein BAX61_04715 [Psychrobacter sp. B29-1]|tara:strand:+ start:628 stop:1380 length:753 start_codon:yes stop_codon:yes gene_type:complete
MALLSKPSFLKSSVKVGLLTIATSLCMPLTHAAPIYKVIDEQTGQVTFTDRPQSYEQQTGKQISQIAITTGNETNSSGVANTASSSATNGSDVITQPVAATQTLNAPATATTTATVKAPVSYQLTIAEPSEERAYRRPVQNIDVNVQIRPALQVGDSARIYFDDKEVAQGLSASIATVDVLPGAHTIKAVIQSETGQTLEQITRTVYVIQNTTTLQDNKRKAEQLLAYQKLAWYQKLMLKLRQQEVAQSQ